MAKTTQKNVLSIPKIRDFGARLGSIKAEADSLGFHATARLIDIALQKLGFEAERAFLTPQKQKDKIAKEKPNGR